MKKTQLAKFREKKIVDLKKDVSEKKLEFLKVTADMKSAREKNLKKAKNIRRDTAQILTVLREKELLKKESKAEEKREKEEK